MTNSTEYHLTTGLFWSFLERFGSQFLSLVVSVVLARIIVPEDYGVIAAVSVFTSIATVFVTGGFGNALIQKKSADEIDYSSLFYFNTVFSITIYLFIYFLSPMLVRVFNSKYDYKLLTQLLRILGIGIVFESFNSFFRSLNMKRLDFKTIYNASILGTIISASIGIFLAYRGYGVWALVMQSMISYSINTIVLIALTKWHPKFCFSLHKLKPLVAYGAKLMLSSLLTTIYFELGHITIGNRYSSDVLAYYNKGVSFPKLIVSNILSAISSVLFPIMSTITSIEDHRECVRKFNKISTFFITPIMFGFAAVSKTFVLLVLNEKWLPAVIILQIACFDYAIQPIGLANLQYWKASGKANLYLFSDIVKKLIGLSLLMIALVCNKGILPIAVAQLIANIIGTIINLIPGKKLLDYSWAQQIRDVLPQFLLSIMMFFIVYFIDLFIHCSLFLKLSFEIFIGALFYYLGARTLKMNEIFYLHKLIQEFLKRRQV